MIGGAQNQPIILARPHAIEAGGGHNPKICRAADRAPRHLRRDHADLAAITLPIGVADILRGKQQRDKLAAQQLIVGMNSAANADVGDFARQTRLAELGHHNVEGTPTVPRLEKAFKRLGRPTFQAGGAEHLLRE